MKLPDIPEIDQVERAGGIDNKKELARSSYRDPA